jgi:hypothetical protein
MFLATGQISSVKPGSSAYSFGHPSLVMTCLVLLLFLTFFSLNYQVHYSFISILQVYNLKMLERGIFQQKLEAWEEDVEGDWGAPPIHEGCYADWHN